MNALERMVNDPSKHIRMHVLYIQAYSSNIQAQKFPDLCQENGEWLGKEGTVQLSHFNYCPLKWLFCGLGDIKAQLRALRFFLMISMPPPPPTLPYSDLKV